MKRDIVRRTLEKSAAARSYEQRACLLLIGIHELLYAIAERLDVFDDDEEDDEEEDEK
jgi:hypothetical protein